MHRADVACTIFLSKQAFYPVGEGTGVVDHLFLHIYIDTCTLWCVATP